MPVSPADAARIDLAEANVAASVSDFKRQQALAEKAADRGRAVGASLLVAEALQLEASACERMGQSDKAIQLAAQARVLYSAAGYRQGVARTLLMTGGHRLWRTLMPQTRAWNRSMRIGVTS